MSKKVKDVFYLPSLVLFIIGFVDLLRGFMHTFLLKFSAVTFAGLDLSANNEIFLLGVYGISNYLTGFLYLLVSKKAKNLSPYVLIGIPAIYLFSIIVLRLAGVTPQASFYGRYFMYVYFGVCIITFANFILNKMKLNKK